jgi:polar amino acid transport system substrate-binding protein
VTRSLFLLFVLLFSTSLYAQKDVIIAGDQWCPFVCEGNERKGFSVELVEEVLKKEGIPIKYVNSGFIRLTKNIEDNIWHVVTGTDESFTPSLLISKVPIAHTKWVFVTRKDSKWKFNGVKSLEKLRLGTVAGYVYSKEVTDYIEKNKGKYNVVPIYSHNPQKVNLKKLLNNRIDVYIGEEAVFRYWAKEIGAEDGFRVAGVDLEGPLYCGLNKSNTKLMKVIDKGVKKYVKTPEFKKLLEKYKIKNWK